MLHRRGLIRLGSRGGCVMQFSGYYDDLDVECEVHSEGTVEQLICLKSDMIDYWTGEPLE